MSETSTYDRGLRPGMRHNGQFAEGNDARRFVQKLSNGRTLASYAREYTQEAVDALVSIVRRQMPDVKPSDVCRAVEILLDRGHGKAAQVVQLDVSPQAIVKMTTEELERIVAGALPAIEGEFTASVTAQRDEECVS